MSLRGMRVGLFSVFHESHSFLTENTGRNAFQWRSGPQILTGDLGPQIDGFVEALRELGAQAVPLVDARAIPGGPVCNSVVESALEQLDVELQRADHLDAMLLGLHGAMLSRDIPDLDGALLTRLRERALLADIPLVGCLDLHANFSDAKATGADALISYRENPHADVRITATRAVSVLERVVGLPQRPQTLWAHSGMILAPSQTASAEDPMRTLLRLAREIEERSADILAVNVLAGYAYADSKNTGLSFSITTAGDASQANHSLMRLVDCAHQFRGSLSSDLGDLTAAMTIVKRRPERAGPVVIVEEADNIGAGAPGDCTPVLRAFLDHDIRKSAIIINDPAAAAACAAAGVGSSITIALGGRGFVGDAGPVSITVAVRRVTDGRFTLENPDSHMAAARGRQIDMGLCALVQCGTDVTVLITSRRTPPNDLGQWRSQGVEPTSLRVIAVKAAVAHRQAYGPIAAAEIRVSTPGPCPGDVRALPYQYVRRPVFPLD